MEHDLIESFTQTSFPTQSIVLPTMETILTVYNFIANNEYCTYYDFTNY